MSEYNRGQSDTGLLPDVVPGPGLLPGAGWLGLQGALANVRALLCRSPGKELRSLPGLRHTKEAGVRSGQRTKLDIISYNYTQKPTILQLL